MNTPSNLQRALLWVLVIGTVLSGCKDPVSPPELGLEGEPGTLTFQSPNLDESLRIANNGGGELTWQATASADWIDVSPASGTNAGTISVTVDPRGLESGTKTGSITITSNGGQRTIQVSLQVRTPQLSVTPGSLQFGTDQTRLQANVANAGEGILRWTPTANRNWMTVAGGSDPSAPNFSVSVSRAGLSEGTYTGTVSVTSNGGSVDIPVSMTVAPPPATLAVSTRSLDFGSTETVRAFTVGNSGSGTLSATLATSTPWLRLSSSSLSLGADRTSSLSITVSRAGMASGSYTGSFTVSSNGGTAIVTVTMSVPAVVEQPQLSVSPGSLSFGSSSTTASLTVTNTGRGVLNWSVTDDRAWITATSTSNSTIGVSVSRAGLSAGTYSGTVSVTSNGGSASIPVSMTVSATGATARIENQLIYTINVSVNGTVVGSVPPGETRSQTLSPMSSLKLGFTVVESESSGGERMAGEFNAIANPSGTIDFKVDNVIGSQFYFAPVLTNKTGVRLLVAVNWGLQAEKRTGKVAPANTSNVAFGYFRGYSNSNVRAYRDGTNYTGSYLYWQNLGISQGSGRINLSANSAPRQAADALFVEELPVGSTLRLGADPAPTERGRAIEASDHPWNAPDAAFRRANPLPLR